MAFVVVSPRTNKPFRMPVDSSDSIKRRGRLVVLLKARAGVTHDGNLKSLAAASPMPMETTP